MKWLVTLLLLCGVAQAQEVQTGIFCDTQDQVTAVVESGDAQEAINIIDKTLPNACAMLTAQFYRGKKAATIGDNPLYDIVPVLITGVVDKGEMKEAQPLPQWAALRSNLIQATWVHTSKDDPKVVEWFGKQTIMLAAQERMAREYGISWVMCCDNTERVRVKFTVKDGQYWAIPEDGSKPFILPADTIHPFDSTMPDQLAVEGIVMVVKKGTHGAPVDIVTCVWLPQVGG